MKTRSPRETSDAAWDVDDAGTGAWARTRRALPETVYSRLRREVLKMALRDATMARGRIRRDAVSWLTSEPLYGAGFDAADLLLSAVSTPPPCSVSFVTSRSPLAARISLRGGRAYDPRESSSGEEKRRVHLAARPSPEPGKHRLLEDSAGLAARRMHRSISGRAGAAVL